MRAFYERHWALASVAIVLALADICAWSDARVGTEWGTVFFGATAAALLTAVIFKAVMTRAGKY